MGIHDALDGEAYGIFTVLTYPLSPYLPTRIHHTQTHYTVWYIRLYPSDHLTQRISHTVT